jgi:hypothetical protein
MSLQLPPFQPITHAELRNLWRSYPDPELRRLMLEVQRYRGVIDDIDKLYLTTHQSWRDAVGGDLIALHLLKQILYSERFRLPQG